MTDSTKPRRPGRPKGRRNTPREVVTCIPPNCPRCGRVVQVNLQTKPTHTVEAPGQIGDRPPHTRVEFRNITCPGCGQGLSVRTPRP